MSYLKHFLDFIIGRYQSPTLPLPQKTNTLSYWREYVLSSIYTVFFLLGGVAYIPSVYLALLNGKWLIATVDTLAYGLILFFFFVRGYSMFLRTSVLLSIIYSIGITLMFTVSAQYALIWLFGLSVITAVLLGIKASWAVLGLNLCTLTVGGFCISQGIVEWGPGGATEIDGWVVVSLNFMLLNSLGTFSIAVLVERLKHTIEQESLAGDRLIAEQEQLKNEIEQRKAAELEKESLQSKLAQAQKMEAIGHMAGGVAHDLNNILAGITGYPELILMNLPPDHELREPITSIQDSGYRAAAVVADLLTIARGVASVKKIADLNKLVDEYLISPEFQKMSSLHENVSFEQTLGEGLERFNCSEIHVKKCLMNLVINAAEAIEGGGVVRVSTCNKQVDEQMAQKEDVEPGNFVVLSVCDSGTGIPQENLLRIFEPFYTSKVMGKSGSGLGLAVTWNTVQDHDGFVTVHSSASGSCFELYFPSTLKAVEETDNELEVFFGNGEQILIIDDNQQQLDVAKQMLEKCNYKVSTACSGEDALNYLKEHDADLLVLDMIMSPGMNGYETFKEVVKIHPGQKAVIASGFSRDSQVEKTMQLGAGKFVKKPYSAVDISRAVQQCLQF